jgi:trehalose dimycolate hydrolase
MSRMTFSRMLVPLVAVATALLSTLVGLATVAITGPAPTATAASCPDIDIVFARGTGEPDGIGKVGQAFVDALRPQLGSRTVTTYAVNYPATYDFLTAADGAIDASQHIRSVVQQCPSTRIVLGGYSQGAAVVDMLVGIPPLGNKVAAIASKVGDPGSAAQLADDLAGNVAAVVAFGNPSAKFSIPVTSAGPPYGGRAIDLCKDGDPICSRGRNPFAHSDYVSAGLTDQAAGFVAGLV